MHKLPFFNYNLAVNNGSIDLYIDGDIVDASTEAVYREWWNDDSATSFKKIREQIDNANVKTINVFVNSPGGQVTEAMAIHDYFVSLQNKGYTVNTYGRGIIASAATYILMSGKNSTISSNSFFMIHEVSGWTYGTVTECENQVATLRKFNDTIAKFYSNATGKELNDVLELMNKETWYTGDEAVENGFVKVVEPALEMSNKIDPTNWLFNNTEVLNKYNNIVNKNNSLMKFDGKKFANAISDAITNAIKNLGIDTTEKSNSDVLNELKTAVENQMTEIGNTIETTVSEQIENATKEIPNTVSNAVADALKNYATKDDVKDFATQEAIDNAVKDLPTNEKIDEIENEMNDIKDSVANRTDPLKKGNKQKNNQKPSRFANVDGIGFSNSNNN